MGFYDELRDNDVIPLIEEFGQTIILVREETDGVWEKKYDPVQGRDFWEEVGVGTIVYIAPANNVVAYSGNGVVVNFKDEQIDGTKIKQGDRIILTIELPIPKIGDVYTIGSTDYVYVNHVTVSPAGLDVLYKIQVRE